MPSADDDRFAVDDCFTVDDRFALDVRPLDGATVLTLAGELDHDTAEPLHAALEAARARGGRRLLVDVSGLAFCDSSGLNVLLHHRLATRESGGSLELIGLHRPVARMFRITGAEGLFPQHPDVEAALATRRRA